MHVSLYGVFAAAITPLQPDYSIDLKCIPGLLEFLAGRGCHGALLFGTTGEGPSFSPAQRLEAIRVALDWRRSNPDFKILAGTGTPSLSETIALTEAAYEAGVDGVVTLPPYYFRKVGDDGLLTWFSQIIERAVPQGKAFFGYHFPGVSGVPLSLELLKLLQGSFPQRFTGIKDSSGDFDFARQLGERFGDNLAVFTGNDGLFSQALENHATGCITAMANLYSAELRKLWDAFNESDLPAQEEAQARLNAYRAILERYPPFPPTLKALISSQFDFPRWPVCPPLTPLSESLTEQVLDELTALGAGDIL